MNPEKKLFIIKDGLHEILGEEQLLKTLEEKNLKIYWGTATTGKPHIGYFVPITKIADFLSVDSEVIILLADIHAFLDSEKSCWNLLEYRTSYYKKIITEMFLSVGVSINKIKFVRGSDFQKSMEYTQELYRFTSKTSINEAKKAGTETVKQDENPKMCSLIYPVMQALDEVFLDVDVQFGGVDQRKIFVYAEKILPMFGYKKRVHLMNPLVPGMQGDKMSSSSPNSKIDLLDTEAIVNSKIKKAFCKEGEVENNGLLFFAKSVLFPVQKHKKTKNFVIERDEKYGGSFTLNSYIELEKMFVEKKIHPKDLKIFVAKEINNLLSPIRKSFDSKEAKELLEKAYPIDINSLSIKKSQKHF